jgi:peptide/nickel transport system permease protein
MNYLLGRLVQAVVVMFCVITALFALLRLTPGGPAATLAGPSASPQVIAAITAKYGFNKPLVVQYGEWLSRLIRGDLGTSTTYQQPVISLIGQALQPTLQLLVGALLVAVLVGAGLGTLAAASHRRLPDVLVGYVTAAFVGVPVFWTGLLALLVFSLKMHLLPSGGSADLFIQPGVALKQLLLPALVLGLGIGSVLARFVRASMLEVLNADFIRTARAKGASRARVIWRHAFRNALVPVVTVLGIQVGALIAGAVIIESVFSRPGVGLLLTNAILGRDYPTVLGVVFILVAAFSLCNLLVDLLYTVIDPRIRSSTR